MVGLVVAGEMLVPIVHPNCITINIRGINLERLREETVKLSLLSTRDRDKVMLPNGLSRRVLDVDRVPVVLRGHAGPLVLLVLFHVHAAPAIALVVLAFLLFDGVRGYALAGRVPVEVLLLVTVPQLRLAMLEAAFVSK